MFLTSALLWADAFEYDLFVCLGIQTRSLEHRKTDGEPVPESSFSPGCSCTSFVWRVGGGRTTQPLIVLKQSYPWLARGPSGWTLTLQLPGKWGWVRAREAPLSQPINRASQGHGGAAGFCSQIPAPALRAHGGKAPAPWGSSLKPGPLRQRAGRGELQGLARRCYQKPLQQLFGTVPKVFFSSPPAFCSWIAEDDLKPDPTIYQNETVSQIVRPKGPLDYTVQPSVGDRPALLCLISALMLASAATASFC